MEMHLIKSVIVLLEKTLNELIIFLSEITRGLKIITPAACYDILMLNP